MPPSITPVPQNHSRLLQEVGVTLVFCSLFIFLLFFVSFLMKSPVIADAVVAPSGPDAFTNLPLQAQAAIVYDLSTKKVLYAKNADAQLPLASLTKLLTVVGAFRELGPDLAITITAEDERVEAPHRFAPGDTLTLSDLARLTLTASLNDGAAALAEAAATREGTTTSSMLANVASALGLTSTYALNGNGLDISKEVAGGYGSAHDIAIVAGALVAEAPDIALATTLSKASAHTMKGKSYEILNTNPTVAYAPRLLLSKTGYTDLAGGNLALVFDAGINHPIAVVLLGSTEDARFTDGQTLVAATLAHFANLASL